MLDTSIINAEVVGPRGRFLADVGIKDGSIAILAAPGSAPDAREVVDARGLMMLPGVIDAHFHCRAPERPDREDFSSGTAAAAAGGVTTIFEMPITTPCCSTPEVLADRMRLVEESARVDVALFAGPGNLDKPRLLEMAEMGAVAFKIFLHDAPSNRKEAFEGLAIPDPGELHRALLLIKETGLPCAFHAEDQPVINAHEAALKAAGRNDPAAHAESRPDIAEAYAVARVGTLNSHIGARVHICHVSSALAAEYIRWFRARGQLMTAEVTPTHLFLNSDAIQEFGPYVKINPPVRPEADRLAMWEALRDGTISLIDSDHAPFKGEEKEAGWKDIWGVGSGLAGVELTGRLLWNEALNGRITFEQVATWTSENPARLYGLQPKKGPIAPGVDADFVLFDPQSSFTFTEDNLVSRSRDSIRHVLGRKMSGNIVSTWVRGQVVFDGKNVVASEGSGQVVKPCSDSELV